MIKAKKTISLILILIFAVLSVSACSLEMGDFDVATSDSASTNNNKSPGKLSSTNDKSTEKSSPNSQPGFYFKINGRNPDASKFIKVGATVEKNVELAYFDDREHIPEFVVDDGHQEIRLMNWYGSGDTEYTVKDIKDNRITLQRNKTKEGFYFKGGNGRTDFSNLIKVGTVVERNVELAYHNTNGNIQAFTVDDGYHTMDNTSWYGSGNTRYIVKKIEGRKIYLKEEGTKSGFYFRGKDQNPDYSKLIAAGMAVPLESELAFLDKKGNIQEYTCKIILKNGDTRQDSLSDWYFCGYNNCTVKSVDNKLIVLQVK